MESKNYVSDSKSVVELNSSLDQNTDTYFSFFSEDKYVLLNNKNTVATRSNKIRLYDNNNISRLELLNFPITETYILNTNGQNVMSSKYDSVVNCQVFDISKASENNIKLLQSITGSLSGHLNFGRFDSITINYNKNVHNNLFNTDLEIRFIGNNGNYDSIKKYSFYKTYIIRQNLPVRFITSKYSGTLYIDDSATTIKLEEGIKTELKRQVFPTDGAINKYLTTNQLENSLDFSRINSINIVLDEAVDTDTIDLVFSYYNVYDLKSNTNLFVDD